MTYFRSEEEDEARRSFDASIFTELDITLNINVQHKSTF